MNRQLKLNTKILKIIPVIIIFFFLAILQSSFFIHFSIYNAKLNLIFIAIFFFAFLSKNSTLTSINKNRIVLWVGVIGGLFLDVISMYQFGVFTLTLLLTAFLVEKTATSFSKYNTVSFCSVFLFAFLFFKICFSIFVMVLTLIFTKEFLFVNPFNLVLLIELLYNLIIAVLLFFLIKLKKLK